MMNDFLPDLMVSYHNHDLYDMHVWVVNPANASQWYQSPPESKTVWCYCPQTDSWRMFNVCAAMEYKSPNMAYVFFTLGVDFEYY